MAEPIRFNCSINVDDSWYHEDCHWKHNRFFNFTWKVTSGDIVNIINEVVFPGTSIATKLGTTKVISFYYRIGAYKSTTTDYKQITPTLIHDSLALNSETVLASGAPLYRQTSTYKYTLDFGSFSDADLRSLYKEGCITIYAQAAGTDGKTYSGYFTLPYALELAPNFSNGAEAIVKRKSSTKFVCSWPKAEEAVAAEGTTDGTGISGYCVELQHCLHKGDTFNPVKGITCEKDTNGNYKIVKLQPEAQATALDDEVTSYIVGSEDSGLEVYLFGEDTTSVYFNPVDLGFDSRDFFKFTVYPFIVYDSYYDKEAEQILPGSLLSGRALYSEKNNAGGIVRVKTADGWVEGRIWVKTSSGWKEAAEVYTKTAKGWQESF
jgi:hypothetical protein